MTAPPPATPEVVAAEAARRAAAGDAQILANRHKLRLLLAVSVGAPALVVGLVVGVLAGAVPGVVAAVVVVGGLGAGLWWGSTATALRLIGGRRLGPGEAPQLENLVDGLCATFGVPLPRLWLVEDPVPNACAVGPRPAEAVLVVTTGLLHHLDLIETEGVVAHELAHVKCHDIAVSALAVTVLLPVTRLTGRDGVLHRVVGHGREYRADREAVSVVRYPPGLQAALDALARGPEPSPGSVFTGRRWAATRWLWIDPMVGERRASPEGRLDATPVRAAALAEW